MTAASDRDRRVRRLALAVVVFCLGTVAATVVLRPGAPPPRTATGYAVGEVIDLPREWYAGQPTVFFFVRHDCLACQNAVGVLKRLRSSLADGDIAVRLVTPETAPEAQRTFAVALGFTLPTEHMVSDLPGTRLTTVPSVVVVGADGTVLLESLVPFVTREGDELLEQILSSIAGA